MDNSSFLNWTYTRNESDTQKAIVFQSLVATLKSQDALDDSLEAKADTFLKSVKPDGKESAEAFLHSFGGTTADSLTDFVQSIGVLISSPYQNITRATMKMLTTLQSNCSFQIRLSLVKADLIPQLISTLNPQSISFAGTLDIHNNLIYLINNFNWIAAPYGLASLEITDENGQQVVHETVFQQVLAPSEQYICYLCVNRYSIVDGEQSEKFLLLFTRLLQICPSYQPTLDFLVRLPVFLTIPSCLTFFENESPIWYFLLNMLDTQRRCDIARGNQQQMWKTMNRLLRMEGMEEVIEQKLRNDKNESYGGWIVGDSIGWSKQQGTNLPKQE